MNENWQLIIKSVDGTANTIHTFLDLPAATTDAQILNMVSQGQGSAGQIDTNLWAYGYGGIQSGNHVVTVVTYRITGSYSIERIPGQYFSTAIGSGLGDLNFDGQITPSDISGAPNCFEQVLYSKNTLFNPAADINGDGKIDTYDLLALGDLLEADGVNQDVIDAYNGVLLRRFDFGHYGVVDNRDYQLLLSHLGLNDPNDPNTWIYNLTDTGTVTNQDLALFLSEFPNAAPSGGGGVSAATNYSATLPPSVPEPASIWLLAAGLAGLLTMRRRSARSA